MEAEEALRAKFKEIGKVYGYENVEAEFAPFKEFKVKWQRSYKWADFKVSDYLSDAPPEVIHGLCDSLFAKIEGEDKEYSEEMCRWITSPEFSENKQPVFLRRARNITRTTKGESKDLDEAYDRLVELGLVEKDPRIHLTWTIEPNIRMVGSVSVLMKVIKISSVLDTENIPDFVLDYVLYHELCHMMIGFDPTATSHGEHFAKLESKYPKMDEAKEWLKRLCLYL